MKHWLLIALTVALVTGCKTERNSTSSNLAPSTVRIAAPPIAPTEGMWLYNALPTQRLAKLGFNVTPQWAEHLRLSSVRIGGGSGAFVSADARSHVCALVRRCQTRYRLGPL